MKIKDFGVEQWMNEYETKAKYNLGETCVSSHEAIDLVLKQCLPGVSKEAIQNEREVVFAEIIDVKSIEEPTIIV